MLEGQNLGESHREAFLIGRTNTSHKFKGNERELFVRGTEPHSLTHDYIIPFRRLPFLSLFDSCNHETYSVAGTCEFYLCTHVAIHLLTVISRSVLLPRLGMPPLRSTRFSATIRHIWCTDLPSVDTTAMAT